jgi:hypothetical protein
MKLQKIIKEMKKYSVLVAFFTVFISFSQNYMGSLDSIKQDGLHSLMLTTEIRSAANENFNFLRIKDAKKNEVPYVLMYNSDRTLSTFKPLKIISKQAIKDSVTSIIIENEAKEIQDHFIVQIANANIYKNYTIYGSNNQKNWFGLVANESLSGLSSAKKTSVEKTIYFPLNTYQFLRINFNDKNSLPINILNIGVSKSKFFTQNPIQINNFKQEAISVSDKKVTQLKFTAKNAHKIHVISFKINTDFFLRNVKVIVKRTRKVKKRVEMYTEVIAQFQLNSKNENTFVLNNLNEKEFWIEIENQDNPALAIESVKVFQKPIYLVANLKQAENYKLIIDNTLITPSYDLENFISDKTNTIDEVFVSNFSKVKNEKEVLKKVPFWETSLFMWVCISLGGVIVVYFALSLLKDIGNQEKK